MALLLLVSKMLEAEAVTLKLQGTCVIGMGADVTVINESVFKSIGNAKLLHSGRICVVLPTKLFMLVVNLLVP